MSDFNPTIAIQGRVWTKLPVNDALPIPTVEVYHDWTRVAFVHIHEDGSLQLEEGPQWTVRFNND